MKKYTDIDSTFCFRRKIAATSKSNVWLCLDKHTGEKYAVKEIFMNRIANPQHVWNERNVMHLLNGTGISPVLYGTSKNQESLFLVMQLIEGAPLSAHIPHGGFPEQMAKEIFSRIVRIFEILEPLNVVYRDLKLSNLIVENKENSTAIFLCDFGTAKQLSQRRERMESICGTPHAMAPEMYAKEYDYRVDFWSLGILLFELLAGTAPFGYETKPVNLEIPFEKFHFFSGNAKDLISRLLQKDPEKRLCSFSEIWGHSWLMGWKDRNCRALSIDESIGEKFIFGKTAWDDF